MFVPFFLFLSIFVLCAEDGRASQGAPSMEQAAISSVVSMQKQIQEAYEKADVRGIKAMARSFEAKAFTEAQWQEIAKTLDDQKKWPRQTHWKHVVGGHLFFPYFILDTLEFDHGSGFVCRSDLLHGLTVSGKYGNPLAMLYLAHGLAHLHRWDGSQGTSDHMAFCLSLFDQCHDDLKNAMDDPLVYFSLGLVYCQEWNTHLTRKDFLFFGGQVVPQDQRCALTALNFKRHFKGLYRKCQPTAQDYRALSHQGYMPAHVMMIKIFGIDERENQGSISLSKEAHGALATHYQNKDPQGFQEHLRQALALGHPQAYLMAGIQEVGDLLWQFKRQEWGPLEQDAVAKARAFFEKASLKGDHRGHTYLGHLWYRQYKESPKEESFWAKARDSFVLGCIQGNPHAYDALYLLDQQTYESTCTRVGPDPSHGAWQYYKDLLND